MPAAYNTKAEVRQIEPYAHCQSTHSPFSKQYGVSRIPWLSGTVAWSYFTATQHILGIRPDYSGLVIDPCVPSAWAEWKVTREFRGCIFQISFSNPDHVCKGLKQLLLNGKPVQGNLLPANLFQKENQVTAVMG
jgi:cellobiose phosphorylase